MLNKTIESEDKSAGKTNRMLKIMYESVIQETFDFVGIILQLDKVKCFKIFRIRNESFETILN